jgi:hypothetical protein
MCNKICNRVQTIGRDIQLVRLSLLPIVKYTKSISFSYNTVLRIETQTSSSLLQIRQMVESGRGTGPQ